MGFTPKEISLLENNIATNKRLLVSNAEMMREMREVRALLKENNIEYIDTATATRLLNSKDGSRILQKLREGGHLKINTDYYFNKKGFMYRREKIVEIKNRIVRGDFPMMKIIKVA